MTRAMLLLMLAALLLLLAGLRQTTFFQAWPFSWHMLLHMSNVALFAPLLVLLTPQRWRPANAGLFALLACALELVVVWGWHVPALHALARHTRWGLLLEQGMFLLAGYSVWLTALPLRSQSGAGCGGLIGAGALLLTCMHMTLLGAILSLSSRVLYPHAHSASAAPAADSAVILDQQVGGVLMLGIGGVSYLLGGLAVLALALRTSPDRRGLPS